MRRDHQRAVTAQLLALPVASVRIGIAKPLHVDRLARWIERLVPPGEPTAERVRFLPKDDAVALYESLSRTLARRPLRW